MSPRSPAAALILIATAVTAWAQAEKHDLHGVALGATADQITAAAGMPCHTSPTGDVLCTDPAETGSAYKASMSGGSPSVAIAVAHSFCSERGIDRIVHDQVSAFGVKPEAVRKDPNGFFFDIGKSGEGVLNAELGACQGGAKQYEFSIRDDQLLKDSLKQARDHVKASKG